MVSTAPIRKHAALKINIPDYRLDLLTQGEPPKQRFILDPIFPLGTVGLIFGPGGVGKSMIAMDLCMAVASRAVCRLGGKLDFVAGPLCGNVPPEAGGAAVFITLEDGAAEVHRRRASLDPQMSCSGAPVYVIPGIDLPGFDPTLIQPAQSGRRVELGELAYVLDSVLSMIAFEADCPVRLLVLDPAGDFLDGDENDAQFVKALMRLLREVSRRHECTIILLGHTPKGAPDAMSGPTMRGSSAWIANSRAAYALWKPERSEADALAKKLGCQADTLVYGNLVKANHLGAPVDRRRLFRRQHDGRLIDTSAMLAGADEDALLAALVDACAAAAAAGMPLQKTGKPGVYEARADLPGALAALSRDRLELLIQTALDTGALVRAAMKAGGAVAWLDRPDGPLARGEVLLAPAGSRADALRRAGGG